MREWLELDTCRRRAGDVGRGFERKGKEGKNSKFDGTVSDEVNTGTTSRAL